MRSDLPPLLFYGKSLSDLFEHVRRSLRDVVLKVPEDQFLSSTPAQVREHLLSAHRIEPLTLYEDRVEKRLVNGMRETRDSFSYDLRQGETIRVPSLEIEAKVPYSGPPELWEFQPSMFSLNPPRGVVTRPDPKTGIGTVTLNAAIDAQTQQPEALQQAMDAMLQGLRNGVLNQRTNIVQFNDELGRLLDDHIAWRRKNYERFLAAAEALKLPIGLKSDAPSLKPIAVQRRVVAPLAPGTTTATEPPEPGIADATYEHILHAIRNQGRQFERTPTTYAKHDEEELRDIVWGNLSTHFGRDVNGEAFSRAGKTDIRIDEDGRAAFIAECKMWRGAKELLAAVDQLLSYLRWRDCKTALIVFNREVSAFNTILDRGPAALKQHRLHIGEVKGSFEPGELRLVFSSPNDAERRVTVHVFFFDLHVPPAAAQGAPSQQS